MVVARTLSMLLITLLVSVSFFTILPARAEALPFGGQIGKGARCLGAPIVFCYNDGVRWAGVGPPRGGKYIWAPSVTKTYTFGPPSHSGQWLLGLYAPPYFCIASILPIVICNGIIITMMGSSQ